MPRCYMVKKACNKYTNPVRDSWSSSSSEGEEAAPGPVSPTEACVAPSSPDAFYRPLDAVTITTKHSYLQEFIPRSVEESPSVTCHSEVLSHDGGIPIFRLRSAEETEAAHDLLELARSLPPLTAPSAASAQDPSQCFRSQSPIHEIHSRYTPEPSPVYEIEIESPSSSYQPASTCLQYHSQTITTTPGNIVYHQSYGPGHPPCYNPQPKSTTSQPPLSLTPPTSEYSSDAENNNPNPQRETETQTDDVNPLRGVKVSVVYTYDALLVTDGRTKVIKNCKRSSPSPIPIEPEEESCEDPLEIIPTNGKPGRYVCNECGKQYATSSNLSRHKQTHRSLDSQAAKKCLTCGKAYVSMPALSMHLLTHKLSHACGVCGKLFSRPWLLQGHLRSHSGEKPFGCAHCGKAFADRSNLRAHMQTHSSDKNYTCTRCNKSFALKSYLNKHLESACFKDGEEGDPNSHDTADCSEVDIEVV